MSTLKGKLIVPTPEEDREIARGIAADPDTYELSDEEFKTLRRMGRPRIANPKKMVTLRLDQDLLAALKAGGPGWQSRVNEMLRNAVMDEDCPQTTVEDWEGAVIKRGGVEIGRVRTRGPGKPSA